MELAKAQAPKSALYILLIAARLVWLKRRVQVGVK